MLLSLGAFCSLVGGFVLPSLLLFFAVVTSCELFQTGFRFPGKNCLFRSERLSLSQGMHKLLSWARLFEALRGCLLWGIGLAIIAATLALVLPGFQAISEQQREGLGETTALFFRHLLARLCLLGAMFAGLDLLVVRKQWLKRHSMDLEELKREMKESEGNPEVRGMRKQLHQDLITFADVQAVRRAKVLVVGSRNGDSV